MRGVVKEYRRSLGKYSPLANQVLRRVLTTQAPRFRKQSQPDQGRPSDAETLCDYYLDTCSNVGAYTDNFGIKQIRENLAKHLTERDDSPTCSANLRLSDSVYDDLKQISMMLTHKKSNCFLIPDDPYSHFYACLEDLGASKSAYHVDLESAGGTIQKIQQAHWRAVEQGLTPVAIFLNNPTDLAASPDSKELLTQLMSWCFDHNLLVLADESNFSLMKPGEKFVSVKSIIKNHPNRTLAENLESISVFSLPKFVTPEWSFNGGFVEFSNIDLFAMEQIVKMMSMMLSSNTVSQITLDLFLNLHLHADRISPRLIQEEQQLHANNNSLLNQAANKFVQSNPDPKTIQARLGNAAGEVYINFTALNQTNPDGKRLYRQLADSAYSKNVVVPNFTAYRDDDENSPKKFRVIMKSKAPFDKFPSQQDL